MADTKLKEALAEQEAELQDIDRQLSVLADLRAKRDGLYALIGQMRFKMGMPQYQPPASPVTIVTQ